MTLADTIFDGQIAALKIETELDSILGDDAFVSLKFDPYDRSIEFIDCKSGLRLSADIQDRIRAFGFDRCWLNFVHATRTYYCWDVQP